MGIRSQIPLVSANGVVFCLRIDLGGKPMTEDKLSNGPPPQEPLFPPIPHIEAYKPGIDRTLLVENLKLTPEERFRRGAEFARMTARIRGTARRPKRA
jgi:hypothetical protein